MTSRKIIKRSMRRALAKTGLKQKWIAEQLNTTEVQLSRWVNSDHLSTEIIERIAKKFSMTVVEFIKLGE
ncbi:MAG: helix-turn-helix transcriptional regulator [candidate division Zixibacteria bacterium]|nr:helix-turn-helix transcriptional regulator [candidate division Zixibacteria bacterium]